VQTAQNIWIPSPQLTLLLHELSLFPSGFILPNHHSHSSNRQKTLQMHNAVGEAQSRKVIIVLFFFIFRIPLFKAVLPCFRKTNQHISVTPSSAQQERWYRTAPPSSSLPPLPVLTKIHVLNLDLLTGPVLGREDQEKLELCPAS